MAAPNAAQGQASKLSFLEQYAQDPDAVAPPGAAHAGPDPDDDAAIAAQQRKKSSDTKPPADSIANKVATPPTQVPEIPVQNVNRTIVQIPAKALRLPTPGGLAFVLIVLILFWIFVLRSNGKSRFQWFWEVLTGNALVITDTQQALSAPPASSSLGDAKSADHLVGGVLAVQTSPPDNVTDIHVSTVQVPAAARSSSIAMARDD